MSGITADDNVKLLYNDVKMKSTHKWVTFKITDDKKSIVVDKVGEPKDTETKEEDGCCFDEVKDMMVVEEPRYIIYDFGFTIKGGRKIKKIALIFW